MRASASAVPPGAVGTRILTGLIRHGVCAWAPAAVKSRAMSDKPILRIIFTLYSAWMLAARAMSAHFTSSDLTSAENSAGLLPTGSALVKSRSEEHTSELQSRQYLVCRLLLDKNNKQ